MRGYLATRQGTYREALRLATKLSSGGPERRRPECSQKKILASIQAEDTNDP